MNVDAFLAQVEGRCLDLDGAYGCQCVDLADAWAQAVGRPLPRVDVAADLTGGVPGWQWIANTPDNHPEPGDLVVWDRRIGPAGHVDLCVGPADATSFPGLDQNWFNSNEQTGSPAALVTHRYFGVAGWLRPNPGGSTMPATPFYVTVNAGAHWFGTPDGEDMGPAPQGLLLNIVETANDGANDWYRADLGTWWLLASATTPSAPPALPAPPQDQVEARLASLEAFRARLQAAAQG